MDYKDMDEFREYLKTYTKLLNSSINLYTRTIKRYFELNNQIDLQSINKYVSQGFREARSYYVKYAFYHYLKWAKKDNLYKKIVKVRTMPRKKIGKFIPDDLVHKILISMDNQKYTDICMIQYAAGARIHEIIKLKEENIDIDFKPDIIRIMIEVKGGKERMIFLNSAFRKTLKKYMRSKPGYIFLEDQYNTADREDVDRRTETVEKYIYKALRESALEHGVENFGTHDLRRNTAQRVLNQTGNIWLLKKLMGHSDIKTTLKYVSESMQDVEKASIDHQKGDYGSNQEDQEPDNY